MNTFPHKNYSGVWILGILFFMLLPSGSVYAGTLVCSVETSVAACTALSGTVILRMSGATNAHAELPGQADPNYAGNIVCCRGVTGLSNACTAPSAIVAKLSGTSNAHAEQNSQANYANNACISVPTGGTVSVVYQATDCTGFDTILGSISGLTNAHIGDGTAYTTKICGTAAGGGQTITIGATAGAKQTAVNSGATYQYANTTSCASAAACAAFTLSLSSGSDTVTSIKVSETGTANATSDLSNLALFYDTDGNFSNGVTGQYGATTTAFTAEAATVSGSLALTAGTTYYFYVRYFASSTASTYPVGGQGIDFKIANTTDVTVSGASTKTGAPATLASAASTCATAAEMCIKPQITGYTNSTEAGLNYAASCTGCGARIGGGSGFRQTALISGYGFGTDPGLGSRDTATNKVEVAGVATTMLVDDASANTNVSAWSNTGITIRTDTAIAGNDDPSWGTNFGGAAALKVTAGGQAVPTNLNFYLFPQITSIAQPSGFPGDSAREYNAADTDGVITLNGTRFGTGTTGGAVTILGSTATPVADASCDAADGWANTCIKVQVPVAISDSSYTGSIIATQGTGSNNKPHTYAGFRVLPRIISNTPNNGVSGDIIQVLGNHFCQTGTCPVSPNRSNASDNVQFDTTQAAEGDFQNLTGGAGACNGAGAAWAHGEICVKVPAGTPLGSRPTKVTSTNAAVTYTSNTSAFTVNSATPNDPDLTVPRQYKDSGLTQSINVGGAASSTTIYLTMTMSSALSTGMLYPQIEYKATTTAFACTGGGGAAAANGCSAVVEGTGKAAPGPWNCSTSGNGCAISITPSDGDYHWQARICRNYGGTHTNTCGGTGDYASNWVSYGGNSDTLPAVIDVTKDTTPPTIATGPSVTPATNSAVIVWTTDVLATRRVEYNISGTFTGGYDCAGTSECTALDASYNTSHSVTVSNLNSGTTYYYKIRSKDIAGNETGSTGTTGSFQTQTVTQPAKTTKFNIAGSTSSITNGSPGSYSFSVFMTENATSTKSAFVILTGVYDTSSAGATVTVQVNTETAKVYSLPTVVSKGQFKILHKVTAVTVDPGLNTLTVTPDTSTTVYISSADIYVNYSYTP